MDTEAFIDSIIKSRLGLLRKEKHGVTCFAHKIDAETVIIEVFNESKNSAFNDRFQLSIQKLYPPKLVGEDWEIKTRYSIVTWHGEGKSLFYVSDGSEIIASFSNRAAAENFKFAKEEE